MKFLCVGAFWIAGFLVQKFNWGAGGEKALVLLLLLLALPVILYAMPRPSAPRAKPAAGLTILLAVLIAAHLAYFAKEIRHPSVIDVATTTLAAGKAMLAGENPYALPLDSVVAADPAAADFAGYKYLPLMPVVYLPLGAPFGARGLLVTNLLLQFGIVATLLRIARANAAAATGVLAAVLYLAVPLVAQQVLAKGATDLAAVLPLLLALLLVERGAFFSGLFAGLSIAVKPLPGALFLPCLLPATTRDRWRYAAGVSLGCLPILGFALWSPRALYDNIVLFNALRPPDSTSWLAAAPPGAATAARLAFVVLLATVTVQVWRQAPTPWARAGLGAMLTLAALLCSPAAHHNYQLWWLPFYCVALARALTAEAARDLPRGDNALYVSSGKGHGKLYS